MLLFVGSRLVVIKNVLSVTAYLPRWKTVVLYEPCSVTTNVTWYLKGKNSAKANVSDTVVKIEAIYRLYNIIGTFQIIGCA